MNDFRTVECRDMWFEPDGRLRIAIPADIDLPNRFSIPLTAPDGATTAFLDLENLKGPLAIVRGCRIFELRGVQAEQSEQRLLGLRNIARRNLSKGQQAMALAREVRPAELP